MNKIFKITGWIVSIMVFIVLGALGLSRKSDRMIERQSWYD